MAKAILIGNWKNHPSSEREVRTLLSGLTKRSAVFKKVSTYIAPPSVYLLTTAGKIRNAWLGVQDLPDLPKGSHTGELDLEMLKDMGVKLAIIGHSERRALGETDQSVASKAKLALKAGLTPVVCVGELERDEEGEHLEFLRTQIKHSLEGLKRDKKFSKIVIAYEPVWAIGRKAKDAVTPEDLTQSVIFIRKVLTDLFGRKQADKIAIIYGGSVEPANAESLFRGTGVRGFLVGHESLNPESFVSIAKAIS